MNAISMTAEALGWTIQKVQRGLQALLELNYYTFAYLINVSGIVADTCVGKALSFYAILSCYWTDFLTFSNEVAIGVIFISKAVTNFLVECTKMLWLCYCTIVDIISSLYISIINLSNVITYLLIQIFENVVYFVKLIIEAILLILQLGPNLLILLYSTLLYCCSQLCHLIQYIVYFVWENLYQLPSECQKLILSIPLKAYFGIFLLIGIFYYRKIIITYTKLFYNFMSKLSLKMVNFMSHLIFKFIMIIVKLFIHIVVRVRKFSVFSQTRTSSVSSSHIHNPSCSNDNTCLTVKCVKKTVHLLSLPFRKIKEELDEEQIEVLQKELSQEKMRHVCIICHDRERKVLLYPCRHLIMCEECIVALLENSQVCPLCRNVIIDTLVIYT